MTLKPGTFISTQNKNNELTVAQEAPGCSLWLWPRSAGKACSRLRSTHGLCAARHPLHSEPAKQRLVRRQHGLPGCIHVCAFAHACITCRCLHPCMLKASNAKKNDKRCSLFPIIQPPLHGAAKAPQINIMSTALSFLCTRSAQPGAKGKTKTMECAG